VFVWGGKRVGVCVCVCVYVYVYVHVHACMFLSARVCPGAGVRAGFDVGGNVGMGMGGCRL